GRSLGRHDHRVYTPRAERADNGASRPRGWRADASIREPWDDLLPDDLDGPHDLIVGRVADLEHEDHLVDACRGPALDLSADAVRVAADRHPARQQLVVRIAGHASLDPGD